MIDAVDALGQSKSRQVEVDRLMGRIWPQEYVVDWSGVSNIQSVAQVVDGKWIVQGTSLRPQVLGYDRTVAIGEMTWTDYEVTVPITIHAVDPAGYDPPSYTPLVGVLQHWQGHTAVDAGQPRRGYNPLGALACYRFSNDALADRLYVIGNDDRTIAQDTSGRKLDLGVAYDFKTRVQNIAGQCVSKVWPASDPEPESWDPPLRRARTPARAHPLVSHHVAEFGAVNVVPSRTRPRPRRQHPRLARYDGRDLVAHEQGDERGLGRTTGAEPARWRAARTSRSHDVAPGPGRPRPITTA